MSRPVVTLVAIKTMSIAPTAVARITAARRRHARTAFARLAALALLLPAPAVAQTTQVVEYYHTDALGSVRAVTNQQGQVIRRHDFLPFGEELQPTAPPPDKPLFTGKERDAETGLDYFGARYQRAGVGRFTTVDPLMTIEENLADPQRWNRYAYVRSSPLRYVDPKGRDLVSIGQGVATLLGEALDGTSGLSLRDWWSWRVLGKSPDYQPRAFNDGGSRADGVTVQGNTNCYAYALDQKGPFGGRFGMNPGESSGHPLHSYDDITVQGVADRARSDGLSNSFVPGSYPVFFVVTPEASDGTRDYHWYRLDSNGFWSHKPGSTPATNLDRSGNTIVDPARANRGPYSLSGGILWVPPGFKF